MAPSRFESWCSSMWEASLSAKAVQGFQSSDWRNVEQFMHVSRACPAVSCFRSRSLPVLTESPVWIAAIFTKADPKTYDKAWSKFLKAFNAFSELYGTRLLCCLMLQRHLWSVRLRVLCITWKNLPNERNYLTKIAFPSSTARYDSSLMPECFVWRREYGSYFCCTRSL